MINSHLSPTLSYQLQGAKWTLTFAAESLETLRRHQQKKLWSTEKVGQLFSHDLTGPDVCVSFASTLNHVKAFRTGVRIDPVGAATERAEMFEKGLHCIGFWHSHPESKPSPSKEDELLAKDHALAAKGQLSGLLFVIVGNRDFPQSLYVGVHDGVKFSAAEIVTIKRAQ